MVIFSVTGNIDIDLEEAGEECIRPPSATLCVSTLIQPHSSANGTGACRCSFLSKVNTDILNDFIFVYWYSLK